jgi:protein-tyrosine-phosphatase
MNDQPAKILFVCTGNTCRSALAAALWGRLQDQWPAASAGTAAWPGAPAAAPAQDVAREYGADLSSHQARRVRDVTEPVKLVLTMTAAQRDAVLAERPEWAGRVELLTEAVGESGDIADPFGSSVEVYRGLAERLLALERRLLERLKAEMTGGADDRPGVDGKEAP